MRAYTQSRTKRKGLRAYRLALLVLASLNLDAAVNTYYICQGSVSGGSCSDANDGTAKTVGGGHGPWAHVPGQGFTGSFTAHVSSQADWFILRGNDVWNAGATGATLVIQNSGLSATNRDSYGVDQTWFSGGAWGRPVLDGQNTQPPTNGSIIDGENVGNFNIDNLEIKGLSIPGCLGAVIGGVCQQGAFCFASIRLNGSGDNITISNNYIHDWVMTSVVLKSDGASLGGICVNLTSSNVLIDSNVCKGTTGAQTDWIGGCLNGGNEVRKNDFSRAPNIILGTAGDVHDNKLHDLTGCLDGDQHGNVMEWTANTGNVYNNLIYNAVTDCNTNISIFEWIGRSGAAGVYNNVAWNAGNWGFDCDTPTGCSGITLVFENNTVECGTGTCVTFIPRGTTWAAVTFRNNHFITTTSGNPVCYSNAPNNCPGSEGITTLIDDFGSAHTIKMSQTTATAQGYTTANNYAPTSPNDSTVFVGLNLAACSGALSKLCASTSAGNTLNPTARPRLWDAGAYQYRTLRSAGTAPLVNRIIALLVSAAGGTVAGTTAGAGSMAK